MSVTLAMCAVPALSAEPFQQKFLSVRDQISLGDAEIHGKDVTPESPGWSVQKRTLRGGKQDGVEIIIVDNGKLQFTVIPTRGMGVLSVKMGDVRLGWDSPVQELVHPRHINLQSRGGLGWLDGFNEWMVRCGLESNGHPGTDKFINNVGDEATMDLTLHGKIQNIPASEVEVIVDRTSPPRIRIRGVVNERMFYGPKLELQTEISTEVGASTFRISDTITNRGSEEQEFQIIYHANYGRPLLEDGASFMGPIERLTPFNEHAAKEVGRYATFDGPTPGNIEKIYCLTPRADKDGRTLIALQNKARDRAVSMSFLVKELPFVSLWKNTNAEGEGYVTGLEPGTNFPNNRRIERQFGRVPKLASGASHSATIDFAIHVGTQQVRRVSDQIAAIQDGVKPIFDTQPESKH